MLSGTFALAYEGERTTAISAVATAVQVRDALLGLTGLEANAVSVGRSLVANTAGGYSYSVTFTASSVGGNVPALVSFGGNLRGNNANVHVCTGNSNVAPCLGTSSDGNALRGTFRLELLQHYTSNIPYDASGTTMKRYVGLWLIGCCCCCWHILCGRKRERRKKREERGKRREELLFYCAVVLLFCCMIFDSRACSLFSLLSSLFSLLFLFSLFSLFSLSPFFFLFFLSSLQLP